jgi:hypothetical protein
VLKTVDAEERTLSIFLHKEHLTIKDLPIMEGARVLIDGKEGKLSDLKPGKPTSLRMGADPRRNLVVGIAQEK